MGMDESTYAMLEDHEPITAESIIEAWERAEISKLRSRIEELEKEVEQLQFEKQLLISKIEHPYQENYSTNGGDE